MAFVNSSSVVLPPSAFLSPFMITTTKLRTTTTSSSTAINAHASSSITKHAVMNRAIHIPSLNICSLIKHLDQKNSSSSSFSSTSLVVKSSENGQELNPSVAAVLPPAPSDQKFEEEDDPLITKTNRNSTSTSTTAVDAPLVPLVSHDVLKRSDFPVDFMFGAGSSAQQIEGVVGRGPNTWDYSIPDGIAAYSLHKYKEDVEMLKIMGANAYRFSISWARIMKEGSGKINQEGINYYNDLLEELLRNGIKPFVTLFHMDEPAALHKAYGGFANSKIVDDFAHYADICFEYFGDKVQYWTTFNEPDIWSQLYGKRDVIKPPPDTHYKVAHNIILAHARVSKNYRKKYLKSQGGEIGITLSTMCFLPNSNSPKDIDAQGRAWDFMIGWFAEPLLNGDYPFIMKTLLGDRLLKFSAYEKELLRGGSTDFIGVNYYSARYVKDLHGRTPNAGHVYSTADMQVELSDKKDGIGSSVNTYPQGIRDVLIQMKQRYNNPKIYITENGVSTARDDSIPIWKDLEDDERIKYIHIHLYYVREALREGVNVNSYFVWSLLDSIEWLSDYKVRMGLSYTDYNNDRARYPKKSAKWFHSFITQTGHNEGTSPLKPTPEV